MRVGLSINAHQTSVTSGRELQQALSDVAAEQFKEIWLAADQGPQLFALLNGNLGWLRYTSPDGDNGLQSVNPDFVGDPQSVRPYRLSNGQVDEYPESWALAESVIVHALEYVIDHAKPAPFVTWRSW